MGTPTKDQVLSWNPLSLAEVASSANSIVITIDNSADTVQRTIHNLDWSGTAATAALGRADHEYTQVKAVATAYFTLADACSQAYSAMQPVIADLQASVKALEGDHFTVDQDFTVKDTRSDNKRADDATNDTIRLQGLAKTLGESDEAWATKITAAIAEIEKLAPVTKLDNPLFNFLTGGLTQPHDDVFNPALAAVKLHDGIPVSTDLPGGGRITLTPNPDGTITTAQSTLQPDGTVVTKTHTGTGPDTTSVSTPRNDGTGIIDTVTTAPDGSQTRTVSIPKGDGRIGTRPVNTDGTLGPETLTSPLGNGATLTEVPSANGKTVTNVLTRADGSTNTQTFAVGPDGKQQLIATADSAGTRSTREPDGSIYTQFADGRSAMTTTQPDGRVVTKFSDGSVLGAAPPSSGQPALSAWDSVKAWTGKQAGDLWESTTGTFQEHPGAIVTGMAADAAGGQLDLSKASMAQRAQALSQTSDDALARMVTQLEAGDPAAGRSAVTAVTAADDAAALASKTETLAKVGKFGGPAVTAGLAAYVNWQDWEHGKPAPAAIANAVGTTVGDVGGALAGAEAGAAAGAVVGAWFPPLELVAIPGGTILGAVFGGYAGGSVGGWAAEKPFK
ncbi:hypothetical protein VMT65_29800 [Nocardia sp. CDC153]|uniref:hypothetical protein n=1 Tax=Nocardia sp. CDC153 TaxID=3112167 RepID=UPI002DB71C61|nr:hypothetical protein [Nocardia sp. CDC153]MEC3957261.1 hypothetical protein [Nocardia sp. CDC153]